jgi:hypothetical protein
MIALYEGWFHRTNLAFELQDTIKSLDTWDSPINMNLIKSLLYSYLWVRLASTVLSFPIRDAYGNDDRFEQIGQTAEKRLWKTAGEWLESGPVASLRSEMCWFDW